MKKILLSALSVAVVSASFAQARLGKSIVLGGSEQSVFQAKKEIKMENRNLRMPTRPVQTGKKVRGTRRVFNLPFDTDTFLTGQGLSGVLQTGSLDNRLMWQDSNALVAYTNGFSPAEVMSLSQVLDPYAKRYDSEPFIGENMPGSTYSVDTFAVTCAYFRVPTKPTIVDTLRITFLKGSQCAGLSYGPTTALGMLYNDTVDFAGIRTDYAGKRAISSATADPTIIVKDIYLTAASENDTNSLGWNQFVTPVGMSITNDIVGATVTFLSGDVVTPGDSITKYNRLRYATFSEGVAGATAADFVSSNMYRADDDFNMSGNSWTTMPFGVSSGANRYYYPGIAYSSATPSDIIGWQYHWFDWVINNQTGLPVGINEVVNDEIESIKVYPNPATSQVSFNLELKNATSKISVMLVSATGQVVKNVEVPATIGTNLVKMNTEGLSNGLYQYVVLVNGAKTFGKVSINK